jgi:hypothetical protein
MPPLRKEDFVTNDLHRMRERLKKAEKAATSANKAEGETGTAVFETSTSLNRALNKRGNDFRAARRDLMGRCAETSITLEHRIDNSKALVVEAQKFLDFVEKITKELENLELSPEPTQSELADANRELENARLDFIRGLAVMQKFSQSGGNEVSAASIANSTPDIMSAPAGKLIKIGLLLSFPVLLAFIIGCVIIAFAILIGMGIIQ